MEIHPRAPTATDIFYNLGTLWLNTATRNVYILVSLSGPVIGTPVARTAVWLLFAGGAVGDVLTLTGDNAVAVPPTGAGNINVLGTANRISVTGNAGTNTLTLNTGATIATTYTEDAGNAVPAAGNLNIFGGTNMATAGAGSTVTLNFTNANTAWTPNFQINNSSVGITYTTQAANYCQIGAHLVAFTVTIVLSNKGASNGGVRIIGFPFTPALTTALAIEQANLTYAAGYITSFMDTAGTIFLTNDLTGNGNNISLTDAYILNNSVFKIAGVVII